MLANASKLAFFTTLLALALPSLTAAAGIESESTSFPANLAKREDGAAVFKRTPSPTTPKILSRSQQLSILLAEALAEEAHASSASASASATATKTAWASASASASASAVARAKRNLELVQKAIQEEPWENLDSSLLCPGSNTACPIFPRMGNYECVDTMSELQSCGGCASKNEGEDCTAIRGAQGVTCSSGLCIVHTCQSGFKLERDSKGRHRCRKVRKETVFQAST